mgnify:CR=1 FL=1
MSQEPQLGQCLFCDAQITEYKAKCANLYCDNECAAPMMRNMNGKKGKGGYQFDTVGKVMRTVKEIGPATASEIANEYHKRYKSLAQLSAHRIRGIFLKCKPECYDVFYESLTVAKKNQPRFYEVITGNCLQDWVKEKYFNR